MPLGEGTPPKDSNGAEGNVEGGTGTRFEMELELMNCLASPEYLHCERHVIM